MMHHGMVYCRMHFELLLGTEPSITMPSSVGLALLATAGCAGAGTQLSCRL